MSGHFSWLYRRNKQNGWIDIIMYLDIVEILLNLGDIDSNLRVFCGKL